MQNPFAGLTQKNTKEQNSILQELSKNPDAVIKHWVKRQHPPYLFPSRIIFTYLKKRTYESLLQQYDGELLKIISRIKPSYLQINVYVIQANMITDDKKWIIWKTLDQIRQFITIFADQIQQMRAEKQRMTTQSDQIIKNFEFFKTQSNVTEATIGKFVDLLNLMAKQPYLRKTVDFLIFIEHCLSLDKWDLQVYQQIVVHKKLGLGGKIIKFFKEPERERDYFLTLTNQGIMKSDNHLLQSKIRQMIPFTNQMKIERVADEDENVSFKITSCNHEGVDINFYDDYVQAINFGCALGKAMKDSNFTGKNRFDSYAQIRQNCDSKLYNDGFEYYSDLFDAISQAKYQICMTGWMFTPYFRLKRPGPITDQTYRLDGALKSAAERGVRIYIIVFMQPKMFVNNDSQYVQQYFQSLSKNIEVLRHPNTTIPGVWSHHQKMVVVDQKIGFMGGLDICYGRWDTPQHYIYDPSDYWDGLQYNNYRMSDVYNPRDYQNSNLNKSFQPRMGWHDIAVQLRGDSVIDLLRHFIQYWYFVQEQLSMNFFEWMHFMKGRISESLNHQEIAIKEQAKFMQKSLTDQKDQIESGMQKRLDKFKKKIQIFFTGQQVKVNELFLFMRAGQPVGPETHQMCRSASAWTIGIAGQHEQSIHHAYIKLIQESKKFIYIENQFFMGLENKIVQTLAQRIKKAFKNNQQFKIIVVMPLLPGFEGDITSADSVVLRVQVHYQYQAINRSPDSLFERLRRQCPGIIIEDYVNFYGPRQSCKIKGVPITQIIYVHSKLMIVDDERCIIGSANINDRSLLGNRDSQLAIVIQQKPEGRKIFNLRARLFQEHFGLTQKETSQITSNQVYKKVKANAKKNTEIYRTIFRCLPDDCVTQASQSEKFESEAQLTRYDQLKGEIFGHCCEWPLQFMKFEDLTPKVGTKQQLAPVSSFT